MEECFIAIVPPEPILTNLSKIMKDISASLDSHKALTFPPHITLVHRFRTDNYKELIHQLKKYGERNEPFEVNLLKIGHFEDPPIIFVDTSGSEKVHSELLELVKIFRTPWIRETFLKGKYGDKQQKYVLEYGSPYIKEFYNSHLTIAGPDVNEKNFKSLLKKGLPEISENFIVKAISIIKNNEGIWSIDQTIKMGKKK